MARVLLVDDEAKLGRVLTEALRGVGHDVTHVTSGRAALVELTTSEFDVVVTDLKMPEVDGLQVLAAARAKPTGPSVMLMTAFGSAESAVAAMKAGAADYVTKPFAIDELRLRVARLAEQRFAEKKNARLVETLTPALVAESPRMKAVLEAVRRVAPTDAAVLLLGESGTGKTQLARFLHYSSGRAQGPMVEVHCAALVGTLLESELFGHAKGAFTGAATAHEGHLARAHGGTLFLDEIGEVTEATQVRLLRFLEDKLIVPVGGTEARAVDARVVTATNRDLGRAVKDGKFREDFFYRLNVFTITVPPLRERPEDVEPLIDRWLGARGLSPSVLTRGARAKLLAYDWPGNIRELENVLERASILAGGAPVGPELLSLQSSSLPAEGVAGLLTEGFNLDVLERQLIVLALERTAGNKAAAARLLGISRRRLYSRLESLGREEPADD